MNLRGTIYLITAPFLLFWGSHSERSGRIGTSVPASPGSRAACLDQEETHSWGGAFRENSLFYAR